MKCIKWASLVLLAVVGLIGCDDPAPIAPLPQPPSPPVAMGTNHDARSTGTIRGRVLWKGDLPITPPTAAAMPKPNGYTTVEVPHPFAPVVDRNSGGLANAIVSLHGVDPAAAKTWDRPPVSVEFRDFNITIQQGPDRVAVGFVRHGDEVTFASADPAHHMLRARGAAFFTLPFPEPGRLLTRRLDGPGIVELTSGAGYYWTAADLVVSDHPYHAVTKNDGSFELNGVPPGQYELACRVRNWNVARLDRDPETGLLFRRHFSAPVSKRKPITLRTNQTTHQDFTFAVIDFPTTE